MTFARQANERVCVLCMAAAAKQPLPLTHSSHPPEWSASGLRGPHDPSVWGYRSVCRSDGWPAPALKALIASAAETGDRRWQCRTVKCCFHGATGVRRRGWSNGAYIGVHRARRPCSLVVSTMKLSLYTCRESALCGQILTAFVIKTGHCWNHLSLEHLIILCRIAYRQV